MSFNFGISTNAIFGEGRLNELHTQINAPMGAVRGFYLIATAADGKAAVETTMRDMEGFARCIPESAAGNILVAYFSFPMDEGVDTVSTASRTVYGDGSLGNTNYAARLIQEATGGELFAIEPEDGHYQTDDFMALAELAQEEINNGECPAIRNQIDNLDDYDVVFVGYPIWWYDMPAIMYSFFDTYDFSGKTIIPFTTHGGSRLSGTMEIIQELEPDANVLTNAFTVSRSDVTDAGEDIEEWVSSLNLNP